MSQWNAQSDWQQRHDAPKPEPRPDLPSASLPPEPRSSRRAWKVFAGLVAAFVVLMVGYGIGQSGGTANAPVSVTSKAGQPTTVTKTVTPATCTEALSEADAVIATAGDGFSIVSEAMTAASNLDASGIEAASTKLTALNKDRLTPQLAAYKSARDACESN